MNEIATVMGGAGKTKTDDLLKKCVKIATFIPKGGSGKTTTNGNLGWELSKYGRVLIVDCDHQGNITSWLYDEKRCSPFVNDLGDYFYEKAPLKDCIVNVRENIDMVGVFSIDSNLKQYIENILPDRPYAVQGLREDIESLNYDYVIFDLSPAWNKFEKEILRECNIVIPVLHAEYFSVDGIEKFAVDIEEHRKLYRSKYVANIAVMNEINYSWNIHKAYSQKMKEFGFTLFHVGQSAQIAESPTFHEFIQEHDKKNQNIKVYNMLAQALKELN